MARLARIVIPGAPHHVTQRGNRGAQLFSSDADRRFYLDLVAQGCAGSGVHCLAWCLMDDHVHLILVPPNADGLRAALGDAHRRYTLHVNLREDCRGFLFRGRFASYPMDDAHLMAAVRYVESVPVTAGKVARARDWRWSSARSHIAGRRLKTDPLTDVDALVPLVADWSAMLRHGLEGDDPALSDDAVAAAIESRLSMGRPLAEQDWIIRQEKALGRRLRRAKPGPKPKLKPEPKPKPRGRK